MKARGRWLACAWLVLALVLAPAPALAQRASVNYAITADGIDAGGGKSTSAGYVLRASIGQPFATPPTASASYAGRSGLEAVIVAASGTDTEAPSVPTGLAAQAAGSSQIALQWNAATDNVGVVLYQVFRGGVFRATVNAPSTSFGDSALAPGTSYSYTVSACDAGRCSAQSSTASATTAPPGGTATAVLPAGFSLIGNSFGITLDVAAVFGHANSPVPGITANIETVWKWNAVFSRWGFHSPLLTPGQNAAYAASHQYEVLALIGPGEGYWVKALNPVTLPVQSGPHFDWDAFNFAALPSGFNLIATAAILTPGQFNTQVSAVPPTPGFVDTGNFSSLWAWDAPLGRWYFYSPVLDAQGGPPAVKAYADNHSHLHFQDYGRQLGIGAGFWVNKR